MILTLILVGLFVLAFGIGFGVEVSKAHRPPDITAYCAVSFLALILLFVVYMTGFRFAQECCGCPKFLPVAPGATP